MIWVVLATEGDDIPEVYGPFNEQDEAERWAAKTIEGDYEILPVRPAA